jgi:hypothetical protein
VDFERDVMRSLGSIEATIEAVKEGQQEMKEILSGHEDRIDVIEHARSKSKGVMAVLSAVVSAAVGLVVAILK